MREEFLRRRTGEGSMVREAADPSGAGAHFQAILRREGLRVVQSRHRSGDGCRVVEGAERVAEHVEAGRLHPGAYFVGEAAAQDADTVGKCQFRNFLARNLGKQFHYLRKNNYFCAL